MEPPQIRAIPSQSWGSCSARGENPGDITGLLPDARLVTAEFINRENVPGLRFRHMFDAAGFLAEHEVDVINMSYCWWLGRIDASYSRESFNSNLMSDSLAYGRNLVCIAAIDQFRPHERPTVPKSRRNVIALGSLDETLQRAAPSKITGQHSSVEGGPRRPWQQRSQRRFSISELRQWDSNRIESFWTQLYNTICDPCNRSTHRFRQKQSRIAHEITASSKRS